MTDRIYIVAYPGDKAPIGNAWQNKPLTSDDVAERLTRNPKLNVGILLGPETGIIDVECDNERAEPNLRELIPSEALDVAPSWQSKRGKHFLFCWDDRLAGLPGKVVYRDIEFRIGPALQSIIPPSIVDGVRREWINDLSHQPQRLPDGVIEALIASAPANTSEFAAGDDPMFASLHRQLQQDTVDELASYFDRAKMPYSIRADHRSRALIEFGYCPLRGPEHADGAAAVIVNPDGSKAFKCFHSKCEGKTFADIEATLGPYRPVVRLGADTERVVNEVCDALGRARNIYSRGGILVRITREPAPLPLSVTHSAAPRLEPLPLPSLSVAISAVAWVEKWDDRRKAYKHATIPDAVTRAVDALGCWPNVPRIEGVISNPVFLADGSILVKSGYHAASGLYLDTSDSFPPLMPVSEAVSALSEVIADFPFRNDSDRAGWIAGLLTIFARHGFDGAAPIISIDANTRGSGKTLLADAMAMLVEGRKAARTSAPANDDEWRKLLTSIAMAAPPYVLLDNLRGKFGSPALEQALTGGRHSDRVLGTNRVIDVPLRCVWLATANNVILTADMVRRTLPIRLESPLEKPEERNDFRLPNLLAWLKQERPRLAIAALSILRGYHAAGRPDQHLRAWGSFEAWSDLVRSAVVWAGFADPGANRKLLTDADDETALLRMLMAGWDELGFPATVSAALEMLATATPEQLPSLREVVAELDGNPKNALGQLLKRSRGRVVGGRFFDRTSTDPPKWRLSVA